MTARKLTWLLRHKIADLGIECDEMGFVRVDDLREHIKASFEKIENIVQNDSKQRFELLKKEDVWFIRAVQGHSNNTGLLLCDDVAFELIQTPTLCIHGTKEENIESIMETGLQRRSRKHIHFVDNVDEREQISGFRSDSDVLVFIDMSKCMEDGIQFYKSKNGVILSCGVGENGRIDAKYITSIMRRRRGGGECVGSVFRGDENLRQQQV
jgi:2'-phosphotransferase